MVIQPNTDITLYTGVDIGTCQQLAFSSINKQSAYFQSKILKQYVNCTVVKEKIGTIKVAIKPVGQAGTGEITGAELASANYMSFINQSFDNKRIYCYIVDYVYLNNETAEISYMIDYWQTWLFDVTFDPMYIDREHLSQADWAKIEANPYDPTVPQMITEEPLPTARMLEKPFYEIAWFDENRFAKDGRALMSCRQPVTDLDKGRYDALLSGGWKYWNVMLVQAPTDWEKFGEYDALDENDKPWKTDDMCYHRGEFFICQSDTEGAFNAPDWDNVSASVVNFDITAYPPIDKTATSCPNGYWALDDKGYMYRNMSGSTQTFSYNALHNDSNFEVWACPDYDDTIPNPNKVEGELSFIKKFFGIAQILAGEGLFEDYSRHSGAPLSLNGQAYTWTTKPHGCDVYRIGNSNAWMRLANFYSRYNAISQIVGLYGVPADMFDAGTIDPGTEEFASYSAIGDADTYPIATEYILRPSSVRNKKLLTSPFSYIRMVSPDGQIKEYSYEKFKPVSESAAVYPHFRIVADVSGDSPKMFLIPYKYDKVDEVGSTVVTEMNKPAHNAMGTPWNTSMGFNMDEAICVEGFPEISFNTDGYLSFLGAEYAATRANDTTSNRINMEIANYNTNELRNTAKNFSAYLSDVTGSMGKGAVGGAKMGSPMMGGIMAGVGATEAGVTYLDAQYAAGFNRKSYEDMIRKQQAAGLWGNGDLLSTDDPDLKRFAQAKAAYANDNYFGGTGGVIRYMRGMGLFDFVAINVQLRDEIKDYYDKWFDLYGYTSGRCGIPYVIQFCRGGSDLPHWVGAGGIAEGTTYVKTMDCKVEHAMMPVANAIKQMFDAGVRFKKGDLS